MTKQHKCISEKQVKKAYERIAQNYGKEIVKYDTVQSKVYYVVYNIVFVANEAQNALQAMRESGTFESCPEDIKTVLIQTSKLFSNTTQFKDAVLSPDDLH